MGVPGRPKGSKTRPQLRDFISEDEVKKIIAEAKKKAREGDTGMLKFILEQIFGKAVQPMEGKLEGEFIINISEKIAKKRDIKKTN